jgi:hypothetical protein
MSRLGRLFELSHAINVALRWTFQLAQADLLIELSLVSLAGRFKLALAWWLQYAFCDLASVCCNSNHRSTILGGRSLRGTYHYWLWQSGLLTALLKPCINFGLYVADSGFIQASSHLRSLADGRSLLVLFRFAHHRHVSLRFGLPNRRNIFGNFDWWRLDCLTARLWSARGYLNSPAAWFRSWGRRLDGLAAGAFTFSINRVSLLLADHIDNNAFQVVYLLF